LRGHEAAVIIAESVDVVSKPSHRPGIEYLYVTNFSDSDLQVYKIEAGSAHFHDFKAIDLRAVYELYRAGLRAPGERSGADGGSVR
jgi:hypothetical protein